MKEEIFYTNEELIIDFLTQIDNVQSTDAVEMLGALAMIKFCERQWGEKCRIGFKIKNKYSHQLGKRKDITVDEFINTVKIQFEKDTPIDFSIAIPPNSKSKWARGMNFQMKRFGKSKKENTTEDLVKKIEELSIYGETSCILLFLAESCNLNLLVVSEKLKGREFPFEKIMLINTEGGQFIEFHGLWSKLGEESGTSRLNMNTMTFDY